MLNVTFIYLDAKCVENKLLQNKTAKNCAKVCHNDMVAALSLNKCVTRGKVNPK